MTVMRSFVAADCTLGGYQNETSSSVTLTGLILGLRPVNERRRYKVTPPLIGCAQT